MNLKTRDKATSRSLGRISEAQTYCQTVCGVEQTAVLRERTACPFPRPFKLNDSPAMGIVGVIAVIHARFRRM